MPRKLFICADMEGATGVTHRDQLGDAGGVRYQRGCAALTGDINAAIEGAVAAGVDEVLVAEGHAHMRNVLLEDLHPAARLVRGPPTWENKPWCQVYGVNESFDLAFLVGFHSRAGTPRGLLSHTWAGAVVHEITINGEPVAEVGLDAAICGDFGVPVALVTGADDLAREAVQTLGDVECAVVKNAIGFNIAECWGPTATSGFIREAAERAVRRFEGGAFKPFIPGRPVAVELETHRREMVDKMALVQGFERIGERRIRVEGEHARGALSTVWRCIAEVMREHQGWLR